MIENGWAVIYKRYSYPEEYLIIEQKAKIQKKGLWTGEFLYPEQWRKINK